MNKRDKLETIIIFNCGVTSRDRIDYCRKQDSTCVYSSFMIDPKVNLQRCTYKLTKLYEKYLDENGYVKEL